eukprot:PhF_6_TR6236/c0_g1_i1/m.9426
MSSSSRRPYKIGVYGATGYSGTMICEYIAKTSPWEHTEWFISGRNRSKLLQLKEKLISLNALCAQVTVIPCDVPDVAAKVCSQCEIILNCAGPYALTGEAIVCSAIATKTHYVDITGEPQFVRLIANKYDEEAKQAGVAVIPCAGFDCVPTDIGVWYALEHGDRSTYPTTCRSYVNASTTFSTGTILTLINSVSTAKTKTTTTTKQEKQPPSITTTTTTKQRPKHPKKQSPASPL